MKTLRNKLVLISLLSAWFSAYGQTRPDTGNGVPAGPLGKYNPFVAETIGAPFSTLTLPGQWSTAWKQPSCDFAFPKSEMQEFGIGYNSPERLTIPKNWHCDFAAPPNLDKLFKDDRLQEREALAKMIQALLAGADKE